MSYIVEELVNEAKVEAQIETAVKMLNKNVITEERLSEFFDFTPEQRDFVIKQAAESK